MKNKEFLRRLIEGFKRRGITLNYIFSYNKRLSIGIKNNLLMYVDFSPNRISNYYKIIDGIGYQFRTEKVDKPDKVIDEFIKLLHPYRRRLQSIEQGLEITGDYIFRPNEISDLFPFLSFEKKKGLSELLIRFTNRCNQGCEFCSAPILPCEPDIDVLKRLIEKILSAYQCEVTITGGEPTIRKEFIPFVKWLLSETDAPIIRIQTNAVAFSRESLIKKIPRSEKIQFFISLHSLDERSYDIITSSKGQLKKAIRGIRNILKRGYNTIVNVVINKYNIDTMDSYLDRLFKIFGKELQVHFSVLILPEYRKNLNRYIVSYERIVEKILPLLKKYNIGIDSLISSSHASIPLCYLPEDLVRSLDKELLLRKTRSTDRDLSYGWVRLKKCKLCRYISLCPGIPELYYLYERVK